ncbi:nuclear transport factor 2 family protein [Erythrobacter insulae]|uniref:nuclear transport factor 2 family protein n=1 Tax=Erythrobacter insulae TaxID=2584124 RepID=UPI00163DD83F|nr:nuclear transport factor 2 family protein [Erythrobacter insulae]
MTASPVVGAEEDNPENGQDQSAARAVQAHVDAYRSGDLGRFLGTFAPDAIVNLNGVTVATGHQQISALYRVNFVQGAPAIRVDSSGMNGDLLFLSIAYIFPDGSEVCCSYSEYEVTNGKITRLYTQG